MKKGGEWWDMGGLMSKEMLEERRAKHTILEETNGQDLGKVVEKNKTHKLPQRIGRMVSINSKSA